MTELLRPQKTGACVVRATHTKSAQWPNPAGCAVGASPHVVERFRELMPADIGTQSTAVEGDRVA
jgi:hypothetical protein